MIEKDKLIFALYAGHWKLSHTTKNFLLQQGIILTNFALFTFVRTSPRLFQSFGFTEVKPAFIAFTLFQMISSPIDEVSILITIRSDLDRSLLDGYNEVSSLLPS